MLLCCRASALFYWWRTVSAKLIFLGIYKNAFTICEHSAWAAWCIKRGKAVSWQAHPQSLLLHPSFVHSIQSTNCFEWRFFLPVGPRPWGELGCLPPGNAAYRVRSWRSASEDLADERWESSPAGAGTGKGAETWKLCYDTYRLNLEVTCALQTCLQEVNTLQQHCLAIWGELGCLANTFSCLWSTGTAGWKLAGAEELDSEVFWVCINGLRKGADLGARSGRAFVSSVRLNCGPFGKLIYLLVFFSLELCSWLKSDLKCKAQRTIQWLSASAVTLLKYLVFFCYGSP